MQSTIKAILVDDEESAREVLSNLLARFCPEVEILDTCSDVLQAVESIKKHKPEVVFLDIEMPNYNGFELMQFFENIDFEIVFVTAYERYAIRAFEVAAIDYLLKPVDISRLKEAIAKLHTKLQTHQMKEQYQVLIDGLKNREVKSIVISTQNQRYVLPTTDIVAIKAHEAYCHIYTIEGKEYMVSKHLKHYESILEDTHHFFRTHKSWLVNIEYILSYSKTNLEIQLQTGIIAKLSKYKKASFKELIKVKK
ncbi:MAG: response regulator transcription factor [Aureispira sp.]|nr:response regulator transcription factor [Aureispira sp.]